VICPASLYRLAHAAVINIEPMNPKSYATS
jgi:hypothetical protein